MSPSGLGRPYDDVASARKGCGLAAFAMVIESEWMDLVGIKSLSVTHMFRYTMIWIVVVSLVGSVFTLSSAVARGSGSHRGGHSIGTHWNGARWYSKGFRYSGWRGRAGHAARWHANHAHRFSGKDDHSHGLSRFDGFRHEPGDSHGEWHASPGFGSDGRHSATIESEWHASPGFGSKERSSVTVEGEWH